MLAATKVRTKEKGHWHIPYEAMDRTESLLFINPERDVISGGFSRHHTHKSMLSYATSIPYYP